MLKNFFLELLPKFLQVLRLRSRNYFLDCSSRGSFGIYFLDSSLFKYFFLNSSCRFFRDSSGNSFRRLSKTFFLYFFFSKTSFEILLGTTSGNASITIYGSAPEIVFEIPTGNLSGIDSGSAFWFLLTQKLLPEFPWQLPPGFLRELSPRFLQESFPG